MLPVKILLLSKTALNVASAVWSVPVVELNDALNSTITCGVRIGIELAGVSLPLLFLATVKSGNIHIHKKIHYGHDWSVSRNEIQGRNTRPKYKTAMIHPFRTNMHANFLHNILSSIKDFEKNSNHLANSAWSVSISIQTGSKVHVQNLRNRLKAEVCSINADPCRIQHCRFERAYSLSASLESIAHRRYLSAAHDLQASVSCWCGCFSKKGRYRIGYYGACGTDRPPPI
jgi:hypothetical protein